MDESERMLLRRRKQHIAESIELTADIVASMRQSGLLTDDAIAMLQLEKVNQTRVCRLVEYIVALKLPDSFQLFCDALIGTYKWLVRDLVADLKVERGEVKPLPETLEETAALVHRRFGTSKRFAEGDKKEMSELIAIKLQIADDEWRQELVKLTEKLDAAEKRADQQERTAQRVKEALQDFVRDHEKELVSHSHELTTTQDFVRRMLRYDKAGQNTILVVQDNVDRLLKQMTLVVNQRESLYYEKEKCLRLLGIADPKVALDKAISDATGLHIVNSDLQTEDKTVTIEKLRRQIKDLEAELDEVVDSANDMQRQLDERDREISKLRRMVQVD